MDHLSLGIVEYRTSPCQQSCCCRSLLQDVMAHYYEPELKRPSDFNFATDVVDYWADHSPPARLAMHWVSGDLKQERQLTFDHFRRQSNRLAVLFREKLGLKAGERLLIIIPRVPEWWEIATACIRSGIVVCPATTLLVDKDIEYRANKSGASVFVGDSTSVQKLLKVRKYCPKIKTVLQIGNDKIPDGVTSLDKALQDVPKDAQYRGAKPKVKDIMMIYLYGCTSSTARRSLMILQYLWHNWPTEDVRTPLDHCSFFMVFDPVLTYFRGSGCNIMK